MSKTKVGIINVTGYAGVELAFSAMPHKESAKEVMPLLECGLRIVDLSADFRLKDAGEYPTWYGFTHPAPELLKQAVYGLPELYRTQVGTAQLVANPGCYATGAILALAPAVKEGVTGADIVIDSKSGVSGAGRTVSLETHYSEANEDVTAYALAGHRHLPEIIKELTLLRPQPSPSVTFVPHLVPMTRGLLTTAYAPLTGKVSPDKAGEEELRQLYRSFYKDDPFVRVLDFSPHTKHTWGSNLCLIHPTIDRRTGRLIVISWLDNLLKGAAGQAIQNMNLMLGLPETTGLETLAVYP